MQKEFGKFSIANVIDKKDKGDKTKLYTLHHEQMRIGIIRVVPVISDAHPFLCKNTCYQIDTWEVFDKKRRLSCIYTPDFTLGSVLQEGFGRIIYNLIIGQVSGEKAYLIRNFTLAQEYSSGTRTVDYLWDAMLDEGKARILNPDLPLIVAPYPVFADEE
jgi:hypothetical protein